MGVAVLDIPVMNPLRFVAVDGELPKDPRCNTNHFDEGWFADYVRDWQTKTDYIQKWQQNDIISFQLHANTIKGISLDIYDCSGRKWGTINQNSPIAAVAGVNATIIGLPIPLKTYGLTFKLSTLGLPDGIYWFYLTVAYDLDGDGTADYWRHNITEAMSIAVKQYNTTFIEFAHNTNKRSGDTIVIFKQVSPRFSIRAEADVVEYDFNSVDTQFVNESYNASLLSSTVYRAAKYVTTERLPEWMYEKLTEAWSCNKVRVDARTYSKEIDAKWEKNRIARLPKVHLTLAIRPDNTTKGRQTVITSSTAFTIPAYPFAITGVELITYVINFTTGRTAVIHNLTELNAYIATLNTNAASQYLNGSYTISGGDVIWTNGAGDDVLAAIATVFTNPLTCSITAAAALPIFFTNAYTITDWGDSSISEFSANMISGLDHTYSGSGTYTISIFGAYGEIEFQDSNITSFGGKLAAGCTSMKIFACNITSFNCNIHSLAIANLQSFAIVFTNLATITNLGSQGYSQLTFVSLAANKLSTTVASNMAIDVQNIVQSGNIYSGKLFLNGQTPAAPLNSGGAIARFVLTSSYQWQVYND